MADRGHPGPIFSARHGVFLDASGLETPSSEYGKMSTANVIRTLSDFKKEGIIRVFGKTIEIVDVAKLEIISKLG